MKNNKFGFTLVELLAVIAVLALILIIAVPKITKTLDNSKNRTLELSAKSLARSAEEAYLEKETYGLDEEITCESVANINSDDYSYCNISFNEEGKATVTIIGKGQYEGKYICGGSKTDSKTNNEECTGGIPSDILEERHKFYYYSSMVNAVNDVNNNQIGVNQDATKDNAVSGVYTYNNKNYVVLLKDSKETERLKPSVDMIINLNGNTLSSDDSLAINVIGGNLVIDGSLEGSGIIQEKEDTSVICLQTLSSYDGNLEIIGGRYYAITKGGTIAIAFNFQGRTGIVKAYSNLVDQSRIFGIYNYGTLLINDSYVVGARSSIANYATLYIDGGTYAGYHVGALYLNTEKTGNDVYVRNATIREIEMQEGYTTDVESEGKGINVIGSTNSNISVYIDNCNIYSNKNQIVVSGETNNIYISNSRLHNLDDDNILNINISNNNKLYIGRGNNFTKENTNLPEVVTETNEVYIKNYN